MEIILSLYSTSASATEQELTQSVHQWTGLKPSVGDLCLRFCLENEWCSLLCRTIVSGLSHCPWYQDVWSSLWPSLVSRSVLTTLFAEFSSQKSFSDSAYLSSSQPLRLIGRPWQSQPGMYGASNQKGVLDFNKMFSAIPPSAWPMWMSPFAYGGNIMQHESIFYLSCLTDFAVKDLLLYQES